MVDKIQEVKDLEMTALTDRKEEKTMAESMKDFEKELEESYKVMGDGENQRTVCRAGNTGCNSIRYCK